jgi:hypothetical protein
MPLRRASGESPLLVTMNGGKTWAEYALPKSLSGPEALDCVNDEDCWGVGIRSPADSDIVMATTNFGRSWVVQNQASISVSMGVTYGISCPGLADCVIVGIGALTTGNGGATWTKRSLRVPVTAGSRDAVVAAYAQAGAEVAGADPGDPQQAAGRFLTWLETTSRRWLVVLADPADVRGLWPPASARGRVLVTTRRRDAVLSGAGRRLVEVGLFTPGEAVAYLTANLAAHGQAGRADQVAGLAADLGFLPLALAQAAAYLADLGLDCETYRSRLADRRHKLPDLVPDDSGLPDDHRGTRGPTGARLRWCPADSSAWGHHVRHPFCGGDSSACRGSRDVLKRRHPSSRCQSELDLDHWIFAPTLSDEEGQG